MHGEQRTFIAASQSEGCQRPYDTKDILGEYSSNLALSRIRFVDGQARARGCHDLLLFGASELSQYCLGHGSWRLNCEGVHEHG